MTSRCALHQLEAPGPADAARIASATTDAAPMARPRTRRQQDAAEDGTADQMADSSVKLNAIFQALSHDTRRDMLRRLARGELTVSELAGPFDITATAVAKHLRVLEKAGLVQRIISGRSHYFHLVPLPLIDADEWLRFYKCLEESMSASDGPDTEIEALPGPPQRPVSESRVSDDGGRLVPLDGELRLRPGSWAERVLSRVSEQPGQTVSDLSVALELGAKSTRLYAPVRSLLANGVIVRDRRRHYPVVVHAQAGLRSLQGCSTL